MEKLKTFYFTVIAVLWTFIVFLPSFHLIWTEKTVLNGAYGWGVIAGSMFIGIWAVTIKFWMED